MKKSMSVIAMSVVGVAILASCVNGPDSAEPNNSNNMVDGRVSGFVILTDHHTGCEYLSTYDGVTPRTGRNGYQSGCRGELRNDLYDLKVRAKIKQTGLE